MTLRQPTFYQITLALKSGASILPACAIIG
jgi:hypothetical protein